MLIEIPDNATNLEVLQTVFPYWGFKAINDEEGRTKEIVGNKYFRDNACFSVTWWNKPYKEVLLGYAEQHN